MLWRLHDVTLLWLVQAIKALQNQLRLVSNWIEHFLRKNAGSYYINQLRINPGMGNQMHNGNVHPD